MKRLNPATKAATKAQSCGLGFTWSMKTMTIQSPSGMRLCWDGGPGSTVKHCNVSARTTATIIVSPTFRRVAVLIGANSIYQSAH
jgi:hypothetical protein